MNTNDAGNTGGLKPGSLDAALERQALRRGALRDDAARLVALGQALREAEREGRPIPSLSDSDIAEILTGQTGSLQLGSLLAAKARQQARKAAHRQGRPASELQLAARGEPRAGAALAALNGTGAYVESLRRQLGGFSFGSAHGAPRGIR